MSTNENPDVRAARRLLREARQGALATLTEHGAPYASLVAVASDPAGSPLLLISRLALHTRNLLADPRVSLLLAVVGAPDPLQDVRIMIAATARVLEGEARAVARRRYLAVHPAAAMFVDFSDFLFVRLDLQAVHLVAGFGRIRDLTPEDVLTPVSGAESVLDAEESAIEHMNADHADALALYATRLRDAPSGDWRCTGLDPDGLDLALGSQALRVEFPARVTSAGELRVTLARLAEQARSMHLSSG